MINSRDYKLHPETLRLITNAINHIPNIDFDSQGTKPFLVGDMIFTTLFLYARRVGTDKEHIEYLSKVLPLDTLSLTDLLGAIDKYQKELEL